MENKITYVDFGFTNQDFIDITDALIHRRDRLKDICEDLSDVSLRDSLNIACGRLNELAKKFYEYIDD